MKKTAAKKTAAPSKKAIAGRSPFPKDIPPMLATLVDKPFDEPGWVYELKWDGYRALGYINNGKVNTSGVATNDPDGVQDKIAHK